MSGNVLYYGDNLDVLSRHVPDESVDLVYLDPPFNSNATYNVLFGRADEKAAAQIKAFDDTWHWDQVAAAAFHEVLTQGGPVADALAAFQTMLGPSTMLAYLSMMAPRLVELRRVLKPTGSIYLHCDPTASHYLKLLMDATFGADRFLSEAVWKRTTAHNSAKRYGPVHDVILLYSKTADYVWRPAFQAYDPEYVASKYRHVDAAGRRYRLSDLTGPGRREGPSGQRWRNYNPTDSGRHWQPPSYCYDKYQALTGEELSQYPLLERLDKLDAVGLIQWPSKEGGKPEHRRFLEDMPGVPLQDVWTDIDAINARAAERLGYPTQKPIALLERIIEASCPPDGLVLDPFCGCGTTIAAADRLGRRWIGIDITYLAVALIKSRLTEAGTSDYTVLGEPTTADDAAQLAADDPYQFQWWALGLIGARPAEGKKGADQGIDGRVYFFDDDTDKPKQLIVSVKAGHVTVSHVRDLVGVLQRENAQMGALISLNEPTAPMRQEAASAGFYTSPWGEHPRVQLLTVAELLAGKQLDRPGGGAHMAAAMPPVPEVHPGQLTLGD
jgi:DNA modification methylase